MRVQISATSNWNFDKTVIIEVNSIDEAIKRVQTDKTLVQSVIDNDISWQTKETPNAFIIFTDFVFEEDFDVELIIYDYYWE